MVNDIGLIFEFISAISISALAFIFPGVFFVIAEKKFGTSFQKSQNGTMRLRAWLFIALGIFAFLFQITANIMEILEGDLTDWVERKRIKWRI